MTSNNNTHPKFILDCSVTMSWCFEDEITKYTQGVLNSIKSHTPIVPNIWPLEVSNVLAVAERKKRMTNLQIHTFLEDLACLPIQIDNSTNDRVFGSILTLARQQQLSTYDAAYLELAIRHNALFATLDKQLKKAAAAVGIKLFLT